MKSERCFPAGCLSPDVSCAETTLAPKVLCAEITVLPFLRLALWLTVRTRQFVPLCQTRRTEQSKGTNSIMSASGMDRKREAQETSLEFFFAVHVHHVSVESVD